MHIIFIIIDTDVDTNMPEWSARTLHHISLFKGAQSDCFRFFSNFRRFWYQKKAHIFLITPGEFHSFKMYRLKNINENVTSYGNHN